MLLQKTLQKKKTDDNENFDDNNYQATVKDSREDIAKLFEQ